MTATQKRHSCDECQSDYFCSRLKTAMAVIQASHDDTIPAEYQRQLDEIKKQITTAGFAYPVGEAPCDYAANPEKVRDLTDELIRLSMRIKRQAADTDQIRHRCYKEEVHCE